jgi:ubiquinone/menaquinone biosynthesis C-methylase UbiE
MNPIPAESVPAIDEVHFRQIAADYNHYRHFDMEPVHYLVRNIPGDLQAICDLGTGTGRYLIPLVEAFSRAGVVVREAYGLDASAEMLEIARSGGAGSPVAVKWLQGTSANTGLPDHRLSLVTSFNAFHHFPISETLRETARILRPGGRMCLYIRTRSQEKEHIWGRYFPGFAERRPAPTRRQMEELSSRRPAFRLIDTKVFHYVRTTTFNWVCRQTWNKHYSTFAHYSDKEFESAFARFRTTLRMMRADRGPIVYRSSYTLFLYQLEDARLQ